MARPLRIEFPDALYHVTSRGNERRAIFRSDHDRRTFLGFLGTAARRFGWSVTAWVLMTNHFHVVIQTPEPNLSRGMQWLNGVYAGWFNARHHRSGHLFQGRFKAVLVDSQRYFAEVLRYVVLNPVRAKMVERPEDYRWSSYHVTAGQEAHRTGSWRQRWRRLEGLMPRRRRTIARTSTPGLAPANSCGTKWSAACTSEAIRG
jgi:putative transposase